MTDRISLGALWEDTIAFVRAEWSLLLPVALAGFGLPMVVLLLAVPVDQAESGRIAVGPWMAWLLPCGVLSMIGSLAISAMALRPGASVRDCLGIAIARVPVGIALFLLNIGLQVLLAIPIAVLARIDIAMSGGTGVLAMLGNLAVIAVMIWLFVRVMPIWALLSERPRAPVAAVRACFDLTRRRYRTLLLVRVVGAVAGVIAMLVLLVPLGALAALVSALTGAAGIATLVSYLLTAAVFACLAALWTVYVARVYARLAA